MFGDNDGLLQKFLIARNPKRNSLKQMPSYLITLEVIRLYENTITISEKRIFQIVFLFENYLFKLVWPILN